MSAAVDEQSCVLFSSAARLLRHRNSTAAPNDALIEKLKKFTIPVLKIKSAAVDEQICVLFSTAARLLRQPQDAAQIAAPIRISPQLKHFYTIPMKGESNF